MNSKNLKPGKYYEKHNIPPVGTHNTIPPFSTKMKSGVEVDIDVIRIIGQQAGPTLYVGGGIHGDEINGVEAILRLQDQIDFNDVKGELILVPVQNPAGYVFRSRSNPYDPIDPDWVHPGSPTGAYSKRMKYILNTLASEADCVIDMHTAGRGGSNNPMAYTPPEIGNGAGKRSLELSIAFGGDRIIQGDNEEDYGWPVQLAMPFVAVREGRAGIYPEAGQGGSGLPEEEYVEYFITGVLNVMKAMGMLDGEIVDQGERVVVDPLEDGTKTVRTVNGGIFNPVVDNGDSVKKGQLLAEVHSIPKGIEEIKAPIDGLVIFIRTYGPIEEGGRLISISPP
ncbi:MAG: succinylglutamate desuccinylase/aspartoacylase family protein [Candidatus Bathyarchaeota archaeon]|jgi:hypothetical protein|nr:succinylglutamate desuccinylase/aspartoacylase family protein [Candidatus Bathyarchaeota archaeon]